MSLYTSLSANAEHNPNHYRFARTSTSYLALEKSRAPFFTGGIVGAALLAVLRFVSGGE